MDSAYDIKTDCSPPVTYFFHYRNKENPLPMDKMERFFKIDSLLRNARYGVSRDKFLTELEISPATFKRDLEYLRDRMHAPIEYDRELKGYRYEKDSDFQLPGLWMNEGEIHALLTMQHLLSNLHEGMLDDHIKPLMERITNLLEISDHSVSEINKRIRILSMASRPIDHAYFEMISSAVLERKRLNITYYSRENDTESVRDVSPQRLVHYRDNWYLDVWCHLRNALRTFAVESIKKSTLRDEKAKSVSDKVLDEELGSGYGIFTGSKTQKVQLRFKPQTSRWVSTEQWHPKQESHFDDEQHYILSFPYSDDRELIQDILKYGENIEVLKPESLKIRIYESLKNNLMQYD